LAIGELGKDSHNLAHAKIWEMYCKEFGEPKLEDYLSVSVSLGQQLEEGQSNLDRFLAAKPHMGILAA